MPKKSTDAALSVIKENLSEANDQLQSALITKKAHILELANTLQSYRSDPEYIRDVINREELDAYDLAFFSVEFSKYVPKDDESFVFYAFTKAQKDPLVAYFRNSISDLAFSIFSREVSDLRAVYYDSFSACAEDVSFGISDWCMLPIYDFSDGEMWSVRRLIDKHDLSIVMTVDLPTSYQATNYVRFALLSQDQKYPQNANMLRVTAFFDTPSMLTPFLDSCRYIGAQLTSAVAVPVSFYDGYAYDIDFTLDPKCLHALGVYLSLFCPRVNIGGIYKHLEGI